MISVFVLEDHELVRAGVRTVLEAEGDIRVTGEAAFAAEALARIPLTHPDVVILDVRVPDSAGIRLCEQIRAVAGVPPACLVLATASDDDARFGAIMAGAAGYLLKQVSGNDLRDAVRVVAAGGVLLDSQLTASLLDRLRGEQGPADRRYARLSPQERRVLDLLMEGFTNCQIASRLCLSDKTVKNYVSSLLNKLGVASRTEAAVYAANRRSSSSRP